MKRILCFVILAVMLLTPLAGCGGDNPNTDDPNTGKTSVVGIEGAKLLLAEARLKAELLANDGDIFEKGSEVMRALSDKAVENLSVTAPASTIKISYAKLASGTEYPVLKLSDGKAVKIDDENSGSLGEEKQNIGKMEIVGDNVVWSDFGEVANSYEYFINLTNNIVVSAEIAADMIDFVKKNIRVVDKWVRLGQDKYYLSVKENEELLCRQDDFNGVLDVCRRYRNADGQDVYELYRRSASYEERMTYIPGYRYELSMDNNQYFVADNSKGYWETYVLGDTGEHYNVSYFIMKDDICYDAIYDSDSGQINILKVISADRETDIFCIYDYENSCSVEVKLNGFDGVVNVTAPKSVAGFGEGYAYVTGTSEVKITTANGSVITPKIGEFEIGDIESHLSVNAINVMSYTYGYGAEINISIVESDYNERLRMLKEYLDKVGLTCRRDIDTVLGGIKRAYVELDSIINYYQWNGFVVKTNEGIRNAIAAEKARSEKMYGYFTALKDVEVIDFEDTETLELNINFASIVSSDVKGARISGNDITAESISLSIDDTTLIVKDEPYKIVLAFADSKGSLVHTAQTSVSENLYAGEGSFTATATDIRLVLPQLAYGDYTVVAYIATSDGIRSSKYTPVSFDLAEGMPITMGNTQITAAISADKTLTLTYAEQRDVYIELSSESRLGYEAFSALVSEEAFRYGTPSGEIEKLSDETYTALTGTETEISDGSYRIKYNVQNGASITEGYVYVEYKTVTIA